jgi:hypothetical protein
MAGVEHRSFYSKTSKQNSSSLFLWRTHVWQQDSCRIFIRFSNRPIHPMFEPPLAPVLPPRRAGRLDFGNQDSQFKLQANGRLKPNRAMPQARARQHLRMVDTGSERTFQDTS